MAMRPRSGRPNPSHPPRLIVGRVYEQFKPMSEWRQEDDHDTLLLYLPGFQKEYIKVSTEDVNIVRVRGERLVAENKWSRFLEDFRVPENCDMIGIRARFDGGILTITMPRKITAATIAPRVAPKSEEQPFKRTKQDEALPKPKEEPKQKETAFESTKKPDRPQVTPKAEEQPFRRTKQEEALPKPKEEPKQKETALESTKKLDRPRVAPKAEEQPFRRTKQEEALQKPKEESKQKETALESEKKPERSRSPLKGSTLPPQPIPPSSSRPSKKEPFKNAPEAMEKIEELMAVSYGGFLGDKVEEIKKAVAWREASEDRKLLVNVGVGVLVIVALGVHVSYAIGLISRGK